MPALFGRSKTWVEFPDWRSRYEFVVKTSSYPPTAPCYTHVERAPQGPLSQVVSYQASREAAPKRKLLGWGRPSPLFFTEFFYKDEHGQDHQTTREDLCAAYRKLVGNWQDMFTLAQAVHRAWDFALFTDGRETREPTEAETLALEGQFFSRLSETATQWMRVGMRMFWEAEFIGQHLAFLSDMEDRGQLPGPFTRFPGAVNDGTASPRFDYRVRLWRKGRQIDDYALRAAPLILQHGEDAQVSAIRTQFETLLVEILTAKGYDGVVESQQYYPQRGPPVPHRRPRRKEYVNLPNRDLADRKRQGVRAVSVSQPYRQPTQVHDFEMWRHLVGVRPRVQQSYTQ